MNCCSSHLTSKIIKKEIIKIPGSSPSPDLQREGVGRVQRDHFIRTSSVFKVQEQNFPAWCRITKSQNEFSTIPMNNAQNVKSAHKSHNFESFLLAFAFIYFFAICHKLFLRASKPSSCLIFLRHLCSMIKLVIISPEAN
jgi:hypothetical protein